MGHAPPTSGGVTVENVLHVVMESRRVQMEVMKEAVTVSTNYK